MTAPELKPCPFCGGEAEIWRAHECRTAWIACMGKCVVLISKEYVSDDEAIAAWNRRADIAAVQPAQVRVKPLVWEPVGNPNGRYRLHSTIAWARNTCPYGPYFIGLSSSCKNGEYSWDGPANTGKRGFADPESAKAAAQADYEARILAALDVQPYPRELTVWYGKMPESNGRENWTATLRPKYAVTGVDLNGLMDGFCFARSEFPDRVRYEADRMRWIIGELTEKPHILAYDADLRSAYVPEPGPRDAQIAALVEAAKPFAQVRIKNGVSQAGDIGSTDVTNLRAALAAVKGGDA